MLRLASRSITSSGLLSMCEDSRSLARAVSRRNLELLHCHRHPDDAGDLPVSVAPGRNATVATGRLLCHPSETLVVERFACQRTLQVRGQHVNMGRAIGVEGWSYRPFARGEAEPLREWLVDVLKTQVGTDDADRSASVLRDDAT